MAGRLQRAGIDEKQTIHITSIIYMENVLIHHAEKRLSGSYLSGRRNEH